jgi:O-antigen/teichoic acid export membrane protein
MPPTASTPIKSLFKHSSIYGIGTIAGQAVGFLLLPLYTRYLTPADYGIATIVDIVMALIGVVVGAGILSAMARFYHDQHDEAGKKCVVSTLYWIILAFSSLACWAMWSASDLLAQQLFAAPQHGLLFRIGAAALALGFLVDTALVYLMVTSRSLRYVTISAANLALLVSLNIWFVVFMGLGLVGIFYSMLASRALLLVVVAVPTLARVGVRFSMSLAQRMLAYSFPMIFSALFRLGANESDKFFLNYFFSPAETGIYAIASKIGAAVHLLVTGPFLQSFNPKRFEIMNAPDAQETYARIFNYYLLVIVTAGLAISVYAREILRIMTTGEYFEAARYIPLMVLSWVIFGARYHFETGILIAKQTKYLAWINGTTAMAAVGMNYVLIGEYRVWGALAALNASQLATTGLVYLAAQRCHAIRYRFGVGLRLLALSSLCYAAALLVESEGLVSSIALKSLILLGYLLLLRPLGLLDDGLLGQLRLGVDRVRAVIGRSRMSAGD